MVKEELLACSYPMGPEHGSWNPPLKFGRFFRGEAGGKFISTGSDLLVRGTKLKRDHTYLVWLRPDERSMQSIRKGRHVPFCDSLDDEEIIAIVELK
jgi:hypothetical protein